MKRGYRVLFDGDSARSQELLKVNYNPLLPQEYFGLSFKAKHIYGVYMGYIWSIYGVYMEYIWGIYGVYMGYIWGIYCVYTVYIWGIHVLGGKPLPASFKTIWGQM